MLLSASSGWLYPSLEHEVQQANGNRDRRRDIIIDIDPVERSGSIVSSPFGYDTEMT
jgi:hypothetical protein